MNRVVITGIGAVHACGVGNEAFFRAVHAMECRVEPLPSAFTDRHAFKTGHYIPLPEIDLASHGIRTPMEKAMQPEDRMAILAAKLALEDAGIALSERKGGWTAELPEDAGLVLGVGFTGLETAFDGYLAHTGLRRSPESRHAFHRMTIPMLMTNSPAAWCAVVFGLSGRVHTVNAACASGTVAIGEAYDKIRLGVMSSALCGGVENLQESTGAVLRGFDQLGTCTRSPDGNPRPFSAERSGFLFAEGGACLLMLEERDAALARGARIYAEITGYHENNDAYGIAQLDPSGQHIRKLVERVVGGRRIDLINAHGTGTLENDRIESEVIASVWPLAQDRPWIQASKSLLGHTFGASGAFEAALCADGLTRGIWHGTPGSEPLSGVKLLRETTRLSVERVLSLSFGFGGHNCALVLERHHV